jgi:hypothetical protein
MVEAGVYIVPAVPPLLLWYDICGGCARAVGEFLRVFGGGYPLPTAAVCHAAPACKAVLIFPCVLVMFFCCCAGCARAA